MTANLSYFTPYIKLARLDNLTGAFLLMWPCLWSITLASSGLPEVHLIVKFILGSILMRGAGCIINDLIDIDVDKQVKRTKNRPLASGLLNKLQAIKLLFILLFLSLLILLSMNIITIYVGVVSIIPVIIYPFMKRFTYWPQIFLGIVFNLGVIMGWTSVKGLIDVSAILIYIGCIFWTLGYDTMYAFQDIEDDSKIGVKSSAMKVKSRPKEWLGMFYIVFVFFMISALVYAKTNVVIFLFMIFPIVHLYWQLNTLDLNNEEDCLRKFKSNAFLGLLVFCALFLTKVIENL
jgi:4-hydroxybenzoate polyprenyl transferase